jgi:hypothetical protein
MLNLDWSTIFTEEELYKLQVDAVSRFMRCEIPQAVETSIELARTTLWCLKSFE